MSFAVSAQSYDCFMGRYSGPLAPLLADFAGVAEAQAQIGRVLDVGCGPGALTSELVARLGSAAVVAVDPSESFVAAARERNPGVDVQQAAAEHLPFADDHFDAALAQLVVHFMADPVAGLREMARVTRPGGVVAACVWDHAGGRGPLSIFWSAVRETDPAAGDESGLAGSVEGDLGRLLGQAGLGELEETLLSVDVTHATFAEWWEPYTLGVGPAGSYVAGLDAAARHRLEERCRASFPVEPFVVSAGAWAALGRVSDRARTVDVGLSAPTK